MLTKLLGLIIIAAAGAIAYTVLSQNEKALTTGDDSPVAECVQLTPAQQLAQMIEKDFHSLRQSKQLPQEWNSIATVEMKMGSTLASTILGKVRPNFRTAKQGNAHLELEVMDLPDEANPGIIIQASLFDSKTRNKIFEIGRTYTMNDLNRVKPEAPKQAVTPAPSVTPTQKPQPAPTETQSQK